MKPIWKKGTGKKLFKKDISKCPRPKPKLKLRKVGFVPKGKKGFAMMITILVAVMALLIFVATLPATKDIIDNSRGCSYLNCGGFIDKDADGTTTTCASGNQTATSSLQEDTLSCSILDLAIPFLILGILIAIIYKVTRPEPPQQQFYGGY